MREATCPIECCVIPHIIGAGDTARMCTMQYALYRLAWRGWVRLCATLECANDPESDTWTRERRDLFIHGLKRKYKYWSGEPVWFDARGTPCDPPPGWRRDFVNQSFRRQDGRWEPKGFWVWTNGHDQIKDTSNCFIY